MKVAMQAAARPDASTPDQTETWADCKAAYRLFDEDEVTFQAIAEPHYRQVRAACEAGSLKLIINDTTEIDYGRQRHVPGLGPTGKGTGRGFFLHTALMLDSVTRCIDGLAGQELFYRQSPVRPKPHNNSRRRSEDRESQVWGRLIDQVGPPPEGVKWVHVCDRGADDYEVFCHARQQRCGWVIRAAQLTRLLCPPDGRTVSLEEYLAEQPARGTREVHVPATPKAPRRTAQVELRYASIAMPWPKVVTAWIRKHAPKEPLPMGVVELREVAPPPGVEPVRWVLYSSEPATSVPEAETIIDYYEQRPTVEEFHKALKTGCRVEKRYYETAARLERVTAVLCVLAVRLLQMKTAARENPEQPAREVAPARWVDLLQRVRRKPFDPAMTIRQFVRQLAGLGGHLGRKGDGEPGWITLWRGLEKLLLLVRGADVERRRCG